MSVQGMMYFSMLYAQEHSAGSVVTSIDKLSEPFVTSQGADCKHTISFESGPSKRSK